MWGLLAIPPLWLFPPVWRTFWQYATCRHATSFWVSRPPGTSVTFGPRRRRKARPMDCNSARRLNDQHCGPQARHFAARGYPAWLWPAGSIIVGAVAVAACFLLLMFLFSHLFPAHAD
jgi:hypothetical protein